MVFCSLGGRDNDDEHTGFGFVEISKIFAATDAIFIGRISFDRV